MRKIILVTCLLFAQVIFAQPGTEKPDLKPSILPATPVKDQYMSGTCWSFSSTSLLESELLRRGKGETDLSEMFIARHSMRRKIRRHLMLKGGNYFTPGGQFHDAVWVMKNYGMVPEEVYSGKGRGEVNHHHAEMDTLLSRFVRKCLADKQEALSTEQEAVIDSVLDYYYGKVPDEFVYRGRTYTPRSYLDQYLELNPDDYLEITSYTHHPFYTRFVLEDKYNWTGDAYWNVPLADFARITNTALDNGYTVGWDGDADDPDFNFSTGYALLKEGGPVSQPGRQQAFESKVTLLDHMMHITGRTKEPGPVWYYVKNSWGNTSNPLGGFIYMRDDYFLLRTVAIIVPKEALPADIRLKMGL